MQGFWGSIVVPAHNEATALPHLLASILEQQLGPHRLHIVIVENGSSDGTADIAAAWQESFRAAGHELTLHCLGERSKSAALNAGDEIATAFPRIYLDADVILSPNSLERTIAVLNDGRGALFAAPQIRIAPTMSRLARSYGRVWSRLPYVRDQVPGAGMYAVSREGRRRWDAFPLDIGADDKFARLHFARSEVRVIRDAWFSVHLPERGSELIRVRGRWTAFNIQLRRLRPDLVIDDRGRIAASARFVLASPDLWRDVPGFLSIWVLGYVLAWLHQLGYEREWVRARSSATRTRAYIASPALKTGQRASAGAALSRQIDR